MECIAPGPALSSGEPAPVDEYIASAAAGEVAPAPVVGAHLARCG